jgi:hypothetical protein
VHLDGDTALVAIGGAGVAVIDLAAEPPALVRTLTVPGFAAAVSTKGGKAVVAACDNVAIVDVASGALLGQTWVGNAWQGDVLVAPAKDVELVGDVAFVAAGRFGAVAIDLADTSAPAVIGNCTLADDPAFYASGVRAQAGALYVAGGEYGILPVDVAEPATSCALMVAPSLPAPPGDEEGCSSAPPWELMPWQDLYAPPPPGKDPIQTLPDGDVVYAFGDARRIGARAVDVRLTADPALTKIGRYDEPRRLRGIAARDGRVLVVGDAARVLVRDEAALLVDEGADLPADTVAGVLLADGRWAVTTTTSLMVQSAQTPVALLDPAWSNGIAVAGDEVLIPASTGLLRFDTALEQTRFDEATWKAALPPAIAAGPDGVFLAAPEWPSAVDESGTQLAPHGVFDADDIMNASLWRAGMPRRVLVDSAKGLVEVASLADRAGLSLHGDETRGVGLPAGTYVAGAADGELLYLVTVDRGLYRSEVVTVSLAGTPYVIGVEAFTGTASGVAVDGDRLYVADADRGVRVWARAGEALEALGVVELAPAAEVVR